MTNRCWRHENVAAADALAGKQHTFQWEHGQAGQTLQQDDRAQASNGRLARGHQ